MIADYEEDAHFCLKCHATVIGLENYVAHRKAGCTKEIPKSPLPSQLLAPDESFGLKADDFFSSLELQSSTKKVPAVGGKSFSGILTRSKTAVIQAGSSKEEAGSESWIGGHQLKELGGGDNQTRLIKAVDNLSRNATIRPEIRLYDETDDESEDFDFDEDDEEDDDVPPRSYTGGKWKPSSPVSVWEPPPTYTGGKWKPKRLSPSTGEKWKPASPVNYEVPPPSHTKGKWKPKSEEDYKKKKHISPFRKSNGSVQYWCGPCNRRLASKIVYERHLRSELHLRRTLYEFDDSSHLNTNHDKEGGRTAAAPPSKLEYWRNNENENSMKNAKRIRRRTYVRCEVCRARVTAQMMGKHLISHYHCRKGDIRKVEAQKMVLDNIHNIVLQAPYQCGTCKFYFNTHDHFLKHWTSKGHIENINKREGYIWCAFCKFSSATNQAMLQHLISPEHNEVISVINRSVPIILKKINPISCNSCNASFILNIELRKHCEKFNHTYTPNSAFCNLCNQIFKSATSLQRHQITSHNNKTYFCSTCNANFASQEEIAKHRSSSEHRSLSKPPKPQKCEYCSQGFPNFLQLKQHLKQSHPDKTHNCPHCAAKFAIPQDLTVHIRSKSCTFATKPCTFLKSKAASNPNQCNQCPFSTDSLSELLFHKALHEAPLVIGEKATSYKCPLCDKFFPRASLRYHIRNHTDEKAFVCSYCNARFARKNNWKFHIKTHLKNDGDEAKSVKVNAEKVFLCATCGVNFNKNSTLQKHMVIHTGKKFPCSEPECFHVARTAAELRVHLRTHSDEKNFQCEHCEYKGKTKQQLKRHSTIHENTKKYSCSKCSFTTRLGFHLKRHERVHTGVKPYACPHCDYRSNNLENLRKHVLSTNKHPGKCIYECKFCTEGQFQANFARDFRGHLLSSHGDVFQSGAEAAGYVAGIYDQKGEVMALEELVDEPPDDNSGLIGMESKQEELFPMYIIAKDDVVCVDKDTWSMVASFDVEESGAVVSFNEEGETFFQEHFP